MTGFVRLFCVAFAAIASTSSFAQIVPLPPIPPIPKSAFPSAMCGVDLRGIDIMPMPGRPEQCPLFCFTIDRCDGVTWTNHRGGTCWLKTVFQFAFIGMTVPKAGAISFVLLPGPFSVPVTSLVGVDFPGNDLTNRPTKSDAVCGSLCLANTDCYAWTWTNYNGGTCWLKRKATDPVPKAGAKSGGSSGVGSHETVNLTDYAPVRRLNEYHDALYELRFACGIDHPDSDIHVSGGVQRTYKFGPGNCNFLYDLRRRATCGEELRILTTRYAEESRSRALSDAQSECAPSEVKLFQLCGVDITCADIGTAQTSNPDNCPFLCRATDGCDAATWTNHQGGTCWLKRCNGFLDVIRPKAGAASFYEKCSHSTAPVLMAFSNSNTDFPGFDLVSSTSTSFGDCKTKCENDRRCFALAWKAESGGSCFLKSRATTGVPMSGVTTVYYVRKTTGLGMCPPV